MLHPERLFSPYGVRSVSKYHHEHPFRLMLDGKEFTLRYAPAESTSSLFGGNSNWRGPVWFPLSFLLIEALQKHDACLGAPRRGIGGDRVWRGGGEAAARTADDGRAEGGEGRERQGCRRNGQGAARARAEDKAVANYVANQKAKGAHVNAPTPSAPAGDSGGGKSLSAQPEKASNAHSPPKK